MSPPLQRDAKSLEAAAKRCRKIGANYLASRLEAEAKRLREACGLRSV